MKRLFTLLIISFSIGLSAFAQTAPNFTVTDSWGQNHRLYEDYLNQGKTVVIKIFYVACPPCNSIAPFLEPLYQKWGGGDADVQFIELSTKTTDTDAQVNVYKTTHGTTYPAAGGQGNSVPATGPYTNGTFGLWTGTPTFIVIAPDGTVDYDVYGIGNEGTVMALDEAIAATGANGVVSSTNNRFETNPIYLLSNIASKEIVIQVEENLGNLIIEVIDQSGKVMYQRREVAQTGFPIPVDISSLTAGMWICRILDRDNRIVASYLFVKN